MLWALRECKMQGRISSSVEKKIFLVVLYFWFWLNAVHKNKYQLKCKKHYRGYTRQIWGIIVTYLFFTIGKFDNTIITIPFYNANWREEKRRRSRDVVLYFVIKYQIMFDVLSWRFMKLLENNSWASWDTLDKHVRNIWKLCCWRM